MFQRQLRQHISRPTLRVMRGGVTEGDAYREAYQQEVIHTFGFGIDIALANAAARRRVNKIPIHFPNVTIKDRQIHVDEGIITIWISSCTIETVWALMRWLQTGKLHP
jgi:hypothetical protein